MASSLPYVFTIGFAVAIFSVLLIAIMGLDHLVLHLAGVALCSHAEPKVVPLLAAGAHSAVAVHGVPLATETVASPSKVKGLTAAHLSREKGLGDGVKGRGVGGGGGAAGSWRVEGEP